MKVLYTFLVVLLVGVGSSLQARLPSAVADDEGGWMSMPDLKNLMLDKKRGNDRMFGVTVKYIVPPQELHKFADEFRRIQKCAMNERGNQRYIMKKTLNDNFMFLSGQEWDSYEDFINHLDSRESQKWHDFLADRQIAYFARPVMKVTQDVVRSSNPLERRNRPRDEEMIGLAFRFVVQPGRGRDFEGAWTDVAKSTAQENGNEEYVLRKSMLDFNEYYGAGTWHSWEDVFDHLESKHFNGLKDFAADQDIFWTISPTMNYDGRWD